MEFLEDNCDDGRLYINLKPGSNDGFIVGRADGVILFASERHLSLLQGFRLNYFRDLSGGDF